MNFRTIFEFITLDNPYKQIGRLSVLNTDLINYNYIYNYVSILIVQEYSCRRKDTQIICRCYGIYNLCFQLENRSLLDYTS